MNVVNYRKAQRYADKCHVARDVVHDAYLKWYDKCNKDLFDEPNGTVIRVLKYTMMHHWAEGKFMKNGEVGRRAFVEIVPHGEGLNEEDAFSKGVDTPEELMIAEDMKDSVSGMLKDDYLTVFDMLAADHRHVDIAEAMGCTPQYVNWLVQKIRVIVVKHLNR